MYILFKTINVCCQLALKYSLNYVSSKIDLRQLTKKKKTRKKTKTKNKTRQINQNNPK